MAVFLSASCRDDRNKERLFGRSDICGGLYREKYLVFSGGAWSAELYGEYLTDYTRFRKYLGTHDEREGFSYECFGDTVLVTKFTFESGDRTGKVLKEFKLSISALKQECKME